MKKILKRALPILLVVAMVFTLSAGTFAAIPLETGWIFKGIEGILASIGGTQRTENGVVPLLKELKEFSKGYFDPANPIVKAPVEPDPEDAKYDGEGGEEQYEKDMEQYRKDYAAYIAEYAASVVGIAGGAIGSGEIMLPTYIDVELPVGTEPWDILKVKKGTETIEQGIELTLAAVEFAGIPNTYSYFTKEVDNPAYPENPEAPAKITVPYLRIYNYDTEDVIVTVYFVEGSLATKNLGMDYLCKTYYIDDDMGAMQIVGKIMDNKSIYTESVDLKPDIQNIGNTVIKSAKDGFLSRVIEKIYNKFSKKSFFEVIFGR